MNARMAMLRMALCLTAGFWLIVAWVSWDVAVNAAVLATGALAAAIIAGVIAGVSLLLAAAPARSWKKILDSLRHVAHRLNRSDEREHDSSGWTLILMAILVCMSNLGVFFALQQNPWDDDQGAYLARAAEIGTEGGLPGLLRSLYSGEFAEANRHPLYLAALSIQPEFVIGKVISAVTGTVVLLLSVVLVAGRHNRSVAAVFAVLLATNYAFCFFSTRVVSEIFVVLFSGIAWLAASACFSRAGCEPDANQPGTRASPVLPFAGAGVLLGLAWLSKATGLLLLVGYVIWVAIEMVIELRTNRAAAEPHPIVSRQRAAGLVCLICAFLLVSSPLITRNVRRFGNPFYNVNSLLLFADTYEEIDGMIASDMTTSAAAREFFSTHTVGEIASRELSGLVWELFIILRSLGPTPLDDSRVLFGAPVALLAVATMAARRRPEHRLLLVWGVLHWVVFAWYVPIAAGERFVLPLLIPILVTAGEGMAQLWPAGKRSASLLAFLCVLWLVIWGIATYASTTLAERLS